MAVQRLFRGDSVLTPEYDAALADAYKTGLAAGRREAREMLDEVLAMIDEYEAERCVSI